ncbi:MAG: tRNA (adenosine(37)-N6)-threonylcarbamoyltransferase complex ATPase subunit type 1 TsaE, partial [Candidatus Limivicinus sp.]
MADFISHSQQDTEEVGRRLAEALPGGSVVAMYGDLGAGKTAFVRGMAKGMGLSCRVSSPTFT